MERTERCVFRSSPAFEAAAGIAGTLQRAGFECNLVGGSVRDLLLGRIPEDYDLVTAARPEELAELFPGTKLVGAGFGVSLVRSGEFECEVATAREERNYLDGRHPELVRYTEDLRIDVLRRDFTINALRYDPVTCLVHDSVGGIDDLERGVIRTVGDPAERFSEDHLRMLRAVRFAARLRFELDPATLRAIRRLAPLTAGIAGERLHAELTGMLTGPDPERAVRLLFDSRILHAVLPEVAELDGVEQPPEFHPEGDVLTHTLLLLRHLAAADFRVAWSALLHDVGKPAARTVGEDGRARFFSHETIGAELCNAVFERLRFSAADREAIGQAVRNHMRFAAVREMRPAKLRKLLADPNFPLELELHRLDCIACHGMMDGFVYLLDRLAETPEQALPAPWVAGRDLVAAGCVPGPRFKPVLERIFEEQLSGELPDRAAALDRAVRLFRQEPQI